MSTRVSIKTILPDTSLEVNGTLEGTFAAGSTIEVNITDGVNPVTPDAVTVVGDVVTIEVPAATPAPVGATLMKTGQTTSYRTGDDGDLEEGRATDFFTLASNNPFGNTNRFTDELGGATYTNNIVIDWSTYDGATVLGWYIGDAATIRTWNNAIDICLTYNIASYTNWKLPNIQQYFSILNYSNVSLLNYAPFNYDLGLISSTSSSGTNAFVLVPQTGGSGAAVPKTNSYRHFASRNFTVTGTTLT